MIFLKFIINFIQFTMNDSYIAVLDSGINTSHELFEGRFLKKNGRIVGYCESTIATTVATSRIAKIAGVIPNTRAPIDIWLTEIRSTSPFSSKTAS